MIKPIWKYVSCPMISVTLVTIRLRQESSAVTKGRTHFSASQCPTPSCKLCLLPTLHNSMKHERPKAGPEHPWLDFLPLLTHSLHWETATPGLDYSSLELQLAIFTHQGQDQPPGRCRCSSHCTGCPRCARPAGRPRWHWPGTETQGGHWEGLGPGTALHLSPCSQHHICGSSGAC